MSSGQILITGAGGQLGRALQAVFPDAVATDHDHLDITSVCSLKNFHWDSIKTIINAAAYTNVDGAETEEGQRTAREVNDMGVGNLADIAKEKDLLLVHVSTEYVFDGTKGPHQEDEPPSPLSVYGKTKAAGDAKAANVARHYIVRTSWVVGDGKNFVRTILGLGRSGVSPAVVADQVGRPTFATELARAIKFLIDNNAPFGTYNVSNEGPAISWADFTRAIFMEAGFNLTVSDTTTEAYFKDKPQSARRPLNSVLDLSKIESIGFKPRDWHDDLKDYIKKEISK